jgi:hypothetical protein
MADLRYAFNIYFDNKVQSPSEARLRRRGNITGAEGCLLLVWQLYELFSSPSISAWREIRYGLNFDSRRVSRRVLTRDGEDDAATTTSEGGWS